MLLASYEGFRVKEFTVVLHPSRKNGRGPKTHAIGPGSWLLFVAKVRQMKNYYGWTGHESGNLTNFCVQDVQETSIPKKVMKVHEGEVPLLK